MSYVPKFKRRMDKIRDIDEDMQAYVQDYYKKHHKRIYPNRDLNDNKLLKCPTCRKPINLNRQLKTIYVQTECICCLEPVSKTIMLSCSHANICIKCFKRIRNEHVKIYHPYFIFEDGTPVAFCRKQYELYVRKQKLMLNWQ